MKKIYVLVFFLTFCFLIYPARLDIDIDHDFSIYVAALAFGQGFTPLRDVIALYGPIHPLITGVWLDIFPFGIFSLRVLNIILISIALILLLSSLNIYYRLKDSVLSVIILLMIIPLSIVPSRIAFPYAIIIIIIISSHKIMLCKTKYRYFISGILLASLLYIRPHVFISSFIIILILFYKYRTHRKIILQIFTGSTIFITISFIFLIKTELFRYWYEYNIVSTLKFFGTNRAIGTVSSISKIFGFDFNAVPLLIIFIFVSLTMYFEAKKGANLNYSKITILGITGILTLFNISLNRLLNYPIYDNRFIIFGLMIIVIFIFPKILIQNMNEMNMDKIYFHSISVAPLVQIYPYYEPLHSYWGLFIIFGIFFANILHNSSTTYSEILAISLLVIITISNYFNIMARDRIENHSITLISSMRNEKNVIIDLINAQKAALYASNFSDKIIYQCPIGLPAGILQKYNSADRHSTSYGAFIENDYYQSERIRLLNNGNYPIIRCTGIDDLIPGKKEDSYMHTKGVEKYIQMRSYGPQEGLSFEVLIPISLK